MERKESLLGRSRSTNLVMLLRLSATMVSAGSGVWWRAWRHWERGWTIVVVQKPACGTESPRPTPCSTRRRLYSAIPNCHFQGVLTPSTRRAHQRRFMVLVNGPTRSQCSRHCVSGSWVSFVACFACEGDRMSAGLTAAQETQSTTRADFGYETCSYCSMTNGELPK